MFWVYTLFKCYVSGSDEAWVLKKGLPEPLFGYYQVYMVYSKFIPNLHRVYFRTGFFFWENPPVLKTVNLM